MISVYSRRNTNGTFKVVVVDNNYVNADFEDGGWTKMDVDNEGITMLGWSGDASRPNIQLQGAERIMSANLL
jgi:hypothetical protein